VVANVDPIYARTADLQWPTTAIATANTAKDGTGTVHTAFTADATEGGYVYSLVARAAGTNVATVLRVFINNGSTNGTAANNILRWELTLPATTLSEVAALANYEIPLNIALPAGYKINCTIGTTVAAGYYLSVNGGKY
jgi:hypothetical protein